MDRKIVEEHLAKARELRAKGQEQLDHQRSILAGLERDGHDTAIASKLLETMQVTQRLHVEDCDRLAKELAELNWRPSGARAREGAPIEERSATTAFRPGARKMGLP